MNVKGSTIHSYSGIGFGKEDRRILLRKVSIQAKERWRVTRVLVIDESEWSSNLIQADPDESVSSLNDRR